MTAFLIFAAVVIFCCIFLNNASSRVGVPVLLAFMLLGMLFGNNGLAPVSFATFGSAENICTVALIFIMFYGGFGTRWSSAKGVVVEAGLLASLGVVLTAGLTGLFCHFALGWDWLESFLMGSVVSSTDAASVFSILRSRKLGLKSNTAPLLEVESGSNDPCSYMLTVIMISLMNGGIGTGKLIWMVFAQIVFGAGLGLVIAQVAVYLMRRIRFATSGFDSLFVLAVALISYALPAAVGGNGYLSAYIVGIILGNASFSGKRELVNFFDGLTGLMQVMIFFILGLLAHPAQMHKVLLPAVAIFFVMLLVSRPLSVTAVLAPKRSHSLRQLGLVSFVGLRGAASIVFAILATTGTIALQHDIFNIVFIIVLLSISLQGSLIPFVAGKLKMTDASQDVMKTFTDFSDETDMQFSEVTVSEGGPWENKQVMDLGIPENIILCLVVRPDGTHTVPNGSTVLNTGDRVIIGTQEFSGEKKVRLVEVPVSDIDEMSGRLVRDCSFENGEQLVLIRRKGGNVIPNGNTLIEAGDVLIINRGVAK